MKNNFFVFLFTCLSLWLVSGLLFPAADAGNAGTVTISGAIPLHTDNISATDIRSDNANITWKTNGDASSVVEYGTTTGYGLTSTDNRMNSLHTIQVNGLSSFTVYHYRVTSTTPDGQSATSPDAFFRTVYPAGTTVATATAGTTVTGITATTKSGVQDVSVNWSNVEGGGGTPVVSGNTVTVSNPGNGWSSLQYTGTTVIDDGKDISIGGIQNVVMKSTPVTADLGGDIGTINTQISVPLTQLVPGISIQQNVIEGATTSVANAFQIAAANSNFEIKSVAYTVEFTNTKPLNANLGAAGVTMELGVDHAWVSANGDRDNVRILRFAEDGTKEVLNTHYIRSLGTTDYFRAVSPHGLSVFGMTSTTSAGSSSSGSTSPGRSIEQGGSSSGGSAGHSGVQQAAEKISIPEDQTIRQFLAPFQQNTGTTSLPVSVAGLTATTGPAGSQAFCLDTVQAKESGATITRKDTILTISQKGFTLTVETNGITEKANGVLSGTVRSVRLQTAPAFAEMRPGTVSFSLDTPLAAIPENAIITTTISETANTAVQDGFRSAAQRNDQQVEDIAYIVSIGKTNVVTTGPARVCLTIPQRWAADHGGIASIGIAHISDGGTAAILRTEYTGSGDNGDSAFQATSPQGLSTFGLISLKNRTGPEIQTGSPVPAPTQQHPGDSIRNLFGGLGKMVVDNSILVTAGGILLVAGGAAIVLNSIRSRKKKTPDRKKGR